VFVVNSARFLGHARRSATEVQSHGYAALDHGYINDSEFKQVYAKAGDAKNL
jgi:four helix bundle protein